MTPMTHWPDDDVILYDGVCIFCSRWVRFVATRDISGTYAMVYAPIGRTFKVRMGVINGSRVKAWWFNPRDGKSFALGTFTNKGEQSFTPPDNGEMLDWVLVLDDAAKKYPAPGSKPYQP